MVFNLCRYFSLRYRFLTFILNHLASVINSTPTRLLRDALFHTLAVAIAALPASTFNIHYPDLLSKSNNLPELCPRPPECQTATSHPQRPFNILTTDAHSPVEKSAQNPHSLQTLRPNPAPRYHPLQRPIPLNLCFPFLQLHPRHQPRQSRITNNQTPHPDTELPLRCPCHLPPCASICSPSSAWPCAWDS